MSSHGPFEEREEVGIAPLFLKKSFLNETPTHAHTRPHLYTLAPTSSSQIELTLRDLNFYSDGTPQ